jgi:hypothetical protein
MSNVESLNRQLGRLFNGYMNKMEEKSGKVYKNWTDIVGLVREKLNAARKKKLPDNINEYEYPVQEDLTEIEVPIKSKKAVAVEKRYAQIKPKYRVGRYVYRYLDQPKIALGKNQPTAARREGDYNWDKEPRQIERITTMGGQGALYRYVLEDLPGVSYTERQLRPAPAP